VIVPLGVLGLVDLVGLAVAVGAADLLRLVAGVQEGAGDLGVEVGAGALLDDGVGLLEGEAVLVAALGD
jgi:hypothetical protein